LDFLRNFLFIFVTEEEFEALDERLTKTVPTLSPNGTVFWS